MTRTILLVSIACVVLGACAPANIAAVNWNSGVTGTNAQTRCEQVDMRSKSEMDTLFSKYDGWKLVYISEYTTGNKLGTDAAICFQRAK
jgi:hypothetical protein